MHYSGRKPWDAKQNKTTQTTQMQTIAALNCRKRYRYSDDTWEFLFSIENKRQKTLPKCCTRHEIHARMRDKEKQIAMVQPQIDKSKRHVSSPHNWMNSDDAAKVFFAAEGQDLTMQHFCETSKTNLRSRFVWKIRHFVLRLSLKKHFLRDSLWRMTA